MSETKPSSRVKPYSASEIAKNPRFFEKWSTAQGCRIACLEDIPAELRDSVDAVFNTDGKIPMAWVDQSSKSYRSLEMLVDSELLAFLRQAYQARPGLFSDNCDPEGSKHLLLGITVVFTAWRNLNHNNEDREPWSEADYVANVHNIFRSAAIQASSYRVQTTLSLPQPLPHVRTTNETARIVNSTTIVPDNLVFLPKRLTRTLCAAQESPFNRLRWDDKVVAISESGTFSPELSFNFQATPCAQRPETEGFEFISSLWEDKKTTKDVTNEASRQNRMATACVLRQLAALGVQDVPIFGLVWEDGRVGGHVDWYATRNEKPTILSAPYTKGGSAGDAEHKWELDKPADILEVFLVVRNIDAWTVGGFYERVTRGVTAMADDVCSGGRDFYPWKRVGELLPTPREPRAVRAPRKSRSSIGTVTSFVSQTQVSASGLQRTTVVRQDIVEETVGANGRRRAQRRSMESVEMEVAVPRRKAAAKGKGKAAADPAPARTRARPKASATLDEQAAIETVQAATTAAKRGTRAKTARPGPAEASGSRALRVRTTLSESVSSDCRKIQSATQKENGARAVKAAKAEPAVLRRSPRKRS